jgi:hypothetical protein
MSGDLEQEYFADGMVEDIITELSRFRALFVIARNSTFTYKGKAVEVRQVARELGVRYVVEGSIRKAGNRVRVTASRSIPIPPIRWPTWPFRRRKQVSVRRPKSIACWLSA